MTERYIELLRAALVRRGSKQAVADEIGMCRAYVSRVLSGHLPAEKVSERFKAKVIYRLDYVSCPITGARQPRVDCRKALIEAPVHNPGRMREWGMCQRCENKPEE